MNVLSYIERQSPSNCFGIFLIQNYFLDAVSHRTSFRPPTTQREFSLLIYFHNKICYLGHINNKYVLTLESQYREELIHNGPELVPIAPKYYQRAENQSAEMTRAPKKLVAS